VLFFWQMPHFWVLALKYRGDYAQGGFPTLPVAKGPVTTITEIISWCLGYIGIALVAPLFLKAGAVYLVLALLISAKLALELRAFVRAPESRKWLSFFLWVNFSLIGYLAAAAIDLWGIYLIPYLTR
jgi:protoheme IX farnesyltransferase